MQHRYQEDLCTELESGAHTRLGDAILAAESRCANGGGFAELLTIHHLFGDSALALC